MNVRLHHVFLVILWGISILTNGAVAQPDAGDNELQLTGSFFHPVGSGEGAFNADVLYAYHPGAPEWEVGLRQSIVYDYNDEQPDTWNAVTAPFFNYNFVRWTRRSELVPYLGGLLGAAYNDDDATGTLGPQAGAKWYVSESTFLIANYRYEWFFDELSNSNERQDANHVVAFGIGYNWGGGKY